MIRPNKGHSLGTYLGNTGGQSIFSRSRSQLCVESELKFIPSRKTHFITENGILFVILVIQSLTNEKRFGAIQKMKALFTSSRAQSTYGLQASTR